MFGMRAYSSSIRGEQPEFDVPGVFSTIVLRNDLKGLSAKQLVDYVANNGLFNLSFEKNRVLDRACRNAGVTLEHVHQMASQKQSRHFNPQPYGRFSI